MTVPSSRERAAYRGVVEKGVIFFHNIGVGVIIDKAGVMISRNGSNSKRESKNDRQAKNAFFHITDPVFIWLSRFKKFK